MTNEDKMLKLRVANAAAVDAMLDLATAINGIRVVEKHVNKEGCEVYYGFVLELLGKAQRKVLQAERIFHYLKENEVNEND